MMSTATQQDPKASAQTVWKDFARAYHLIDAGEADEVYATFGEEMSVYTEFISGPKSSPAGLMLRGHGADFTSRALKWMAKWGISEADLAYYEEMAEIYNHTNAFLKLEWHPNGQRLVAAYFRRRPPVRRVLHYFHEKGISPETLTHVLWLSKVLQKDSIHFVSVAFRPGHERRHKLYFSQAVKPETWATIVHRSLTIMEHLRTDRDTRNKFLQFHPLLAPPEKSSTLFFSFSFDLHGLHTSFKIDYPEASLDAISQISPQNKLTPSYQDLCQRVSLPSLSYLGVRLYPDKSPDLKYYADLYG